MPSAEPMLLSQRVVQVRLCLVCAIAIFGGSLQMYLGQPETAPRLDHINRFMGGIYLMSGVMALWAASTIRAQNANDLLFRKPGSFHLSVLQKAGL